MMYNVRLEQRYILFRESFYFIVTEYSHRASHDIPLLRVRVGRLNHENVDLLRACCSDPASAQQAKGPAMICIVISGSLPSARVSLAAPLPGSLFLQSIEEGACLCSQYLADAVMRRHQFRVCIDDVPDLRRGLYKLYNVPLEQCYIVVGKSFYFLVAEYSHRASHGISLPGIRVAGQIMQRTRSMY